MRPFLPILLFLIPACGREKTFRAVIHTDLGDIAVELFNSTPQHRDNFLRLFEHGQRDSMRFCRIERDFAIQFGPPPDSTAHDFNVDAEIEAPMIGGALAAPLDGHGNDSDGTDFFIVMDRPQNDASLDRAERQNGRHFTKEERAAYKKHGGLPHLHGKHTVFGRVVSGMDVAQKIAALPRDGDGRPLQTVRVWVEEKK